MNQSAIEVLCSLSFNGGETQVVLLNDGWIKRVEIEHEDNIVIESLLRIEHQATPILSFLPLSFATDFLHLLLIFIAEVLPSRLFGV